MLQVTARSFSLSTIFGEEPIRIMDILQFNSYDRKLLKRFVRFPWRLYQDDPNWVPPLNMDLLGNRILGVKGLLTPEHPYHLHSETTYFLAQEKGEVTGRIAATINHRHNEFHREKVGFFGFFEVVENYETARRLLDSARKWIRDKGMELMRGPANFSSNETWGLLIENFSDFPFLETTYNKRYYQNFLEQYGLKKAKDIIAQKIAVKPAFHNQQRSRRLQRIASVIKEKKKISLRYLRLKNFHEETELMNQIYNKAWEKNWGFVPMDREEFLHAAENLKIVADPGLIIFAFVENEPVAFIGTVPDVNMMIKREKSIWGNSDWVRVFRIFMRRKKVKRIRLMLLGIVNEYRKTGIDSLLYTESFSSAYRQGYEECEVSWLLEDNVLVIRAGESMGGKNYKKWRLFDIPV